MSLVRFSKMLQTIAIKIAPVICLFTFFWATIYAANSTCGRVVNLYQELEIAEETIKSVKNKLATIDLQSSFPSDCEELLNNGEVNSGINLIWPRNRIFQRSFPIYCDMETDGGGWTVIQRRGKFLRKQDYFNQNWEAFKEGFGNLKEDFWLGNDKIYAMSNQKMYSIRFDLEDVGGNKAYAVYDKFWIDDERNNYTLRVSGYNGNAGDSFSIHDSCKFSTIDKDNDAAYGRSCSQIYKSGWWFRDCHDSNLNGEYLWGKHGKQAAGIIWQHWKGYSESLAATEIKIRRKPNCIE